MKTGEFEICIEQEKELEHSNADKRRKWETLDGGNEVDILETALPNFATGELVLFDTK